MVVLPIAGWFIMENTILKWMMTGGTPISGNPHINVFKCWISKSQVCTIQKDQAKDCLCIAIVSDLGIFVTTTLEIAIQCPSKSMSVAVKANMDWFCDCKSNFKDTKAVM